MPLTQAEVDYLKTYVTTTSTLITAALAFVAALAWNEVIQSIFIYLLGTPNNVLATLSYAVIVTVIAVTGTVVIHRAAARVAATAALEAKG